MIEDIPNTSENLTSINEHTLENGVFEKWNNLKKDITIGVVTYSQNYLLKTLINSFQSQNSDNWKMVIIHDGPINKDLYRSLIANKYLTDERVLLVTSEGRYDDYGHSLRNIIIQKYCNTDWILLTNGDNYYTPNFIENMTHEIGKDKDLAMVVFPCILQRAAEDNDTLRQNFTNASPEIRVGFVDIGQFIVKHEFARKFKINPTAIADGEFCVNCAADIKKHGKKIHRTYSVDFVHNN